MRSYKRYTRRKRLLKQIAVVALSPNRVFTKEQIYQHIYEEAESEVNNRIYGLVIAFWHKRSRPAMGGSKCFSCCLFIVFFVVY